MANTQNIFTPANKEQIAIADFYHATLKAFGIEQPELKEQENEQGQTGYSQETYLGPNDELMSLGNALNVVEKLIELQGMDPNLQLAITTLKVIKEGVTKADALFGRDYSDDNVQIAYNKKYNDVNIYNIDSPKEIKKKDAIKINSEEARLEEIFNGYDKEAVLYAQETLQTQITADAQKSQSDRWKILHDTQDKIGEMQEYAAAINSKENDKMFDKWDNYIRE